MSITSRINEMSSHIEQAYDELQGLGADLTNVNKNIENISMVLDDIYDSMPQVSGEGTNLTLDDTRVGKIKSTLKGNTSQNGTPTPTSPIPVNVVSGDNEITISKQGGTDSNTYNIDLPVENLFDKDNANYVNGWIDGTTMRLNTINGNRMFYIPCKPNSTYTISRSVITSSFRTTTYDSTPFPTVTSSNVDYTVGSVLKNDNGKTLTITTGANAKYLVVHYGKIEDTNLDETLASIQVEYGSKQNNFTPYGTTPIELCKIGNYQDYIYKGTGKNLFDNSNIQVGYYINTNTGVPYANSSWNTSYLIKVNPNTIYTLSNNGGNGQLAIIQYKGNEQTQTNFITYQQTTLGDTNLLTITTDSQCQYLVVGYRNDKGQTDIQLEKGISKTTYEPFGEKGKWYLHKEIGKVVLNGSERGWGRSGFSSSDVFVGALNLNQYGIGIYSKQSTASSWLVNKFSYGTLGTLNKFNVYNPDATYGYSNIGFGISTDIVNDLDAFKTWVSNNNIVFYYLLATPTITEITYQPLIDQLNELEKAMSKDRQTNISQVNNDLPFIISASALKEWSE